ncbi:hypothetical protein [Terrabacter sp. Root181]|uniref:hypothetical protein n=1 Tax=Terrabacter sp. Root181 TaxID=1736484 RepID=UPI0007003747|nr:hypothetical protein [Terrabacter sp. Root181]
MNAGSAGVVAAALLGLAVLVWPRRVPLRSTDVDVRVGAVGGTGGGTGGGTRGGQRAGRDPAADGSSPGSDATGQSVWQRDPVDLFRRWRLRRRPGALVDDVLDLLRGIGPALGAGLTPSRAIELAATSTLGAERVRLAREASGRRSRRSSAASSPRRRRGFGFASEEHRTVPVADIDRLVGGLLEATDRAEPTSPVWAQWAARSASQELALVAAAWRLSESTGAPLASAVDRAVRGLLDARARRGKVAVAVAGPRATVTVLTLLPLTGPLFGLACGIDPATLYLGSPVATVSVLLGLLLVSVGRVWCTRMVRRAVRP